MYDSVPKKSRISPDDRSDSPGGDPLRNEAANPAPEGVQADYSQAHLPLPSTEEDAEDLEGLKTASVKRFPNDPRWDDLRPFLPAHTLAVDGLMSLLSEFHAARERTYRKSFAKRGESGVFHNLARKWDRIEGAFQNDELLDPDMSTLDAIIDLGVYAIKWMDIYRNIHPTIFQEWLERVYKLETGVDPEMWLKNE